MDEFVAFSTRTLVRAANALSVLESNQGTTAFGSNNGTACYDHRCNTSYRSNLTPSEIFQIVLRGKSPTTMMIWGRPREPLALREAIIVGPTIVSS